ncbi:FAD binding domain-containing protein [Biscogniauxia mediterranea]|nr:FAD binding domain-containing protein [Biscogniauxia mediterranea]
MPHASSDGEICDVCVVGAGPAGLTLAVVLARLGLKIEVLDDRPDQTAVGRADGIQPKTIETLQMLGLGDELLRTGVKVYDICMWRRSNGGQLGRVNRQVHYPASVVDVLQPFILLCHQGMVEGTLLEDLRKSGIEVRRNSSFSSYNSHDHSTRLQIQFTQSGENKATIEANYLVGCDGARSRVRNAIPNTHADALPHESYWGVLDGELDTDFPDIWSKTVVFSEQHGSILIIPRERNMTRFYIEMKSSSSSKNLGQEFVMDQARLILAPYRVEWRSVEWFGNYQVAQRVAARFASPDQRAFIAGDASHTHSPKAAQGMNTSMHDSWNLGWKLNLASRGLARECLLETYETERKKVAHDLINFDFEHANEIAGGDIGRLAENFRTNTRFISGVGVVYDENVLNQGRDEDALGEAKPGSNLPPAKVTRYIDANPIDVQLDVPMLGQFRIYIMVHDVTEEPESTFVKALCQGVQSKSSLISRASQLASTSYQKRPRPKREGDEFSQVQRYETVSPLFTFALITSSDKCDFEISSLPPVLSKSAWTIYLDDVPDLDTRKLTCKEKWLGGLEAGQVAVVNVRPDGYVGSIGRWNAAAGESGEVAAQWLDTYYGRFLQAA